MLKLLDGNIYSDKTRVDELSFIYDINTGVLKIGDYENLDKCYRTMLLAYNTLNVNKLNSITDNLGLPRANIPRMCDNIRLVKFDSDIISKETQIRFIKYMAEVSCNGSKIEELLTKPEKGIVGFLDSLIISNEMRL